MANLKAKKAEKQQTGNPYFACIFNVHKEKKSNLVRFLTIHDDGAVLDWHKGKKALFDEDGNPLLDEKGGQAQQLINLPCRKQFGFDCPLCISSDWKLKSNKYILAFLLYDFEQNRARVLLGRETKGTIITLVENWYKENNDEDSTAELNDLDFKISVVDTGAFPEYSFTSRMNTKPRNLESLMPFHYDSERIEEVITKTIISAFDPELAAAMKIREEDTLLHYYREANKETEKEIEEMGDVIDLANNRARRVVSTKSAVSRPATPLPAKVIESTIQQGPFEDE